MSITVFIRDMGTGLENITAYYKEADDLIHLCRTWASLIKCGNVSSASGFSPIQGRKVEDEKNFEVLN